MVGDTRMADRVLSALRGATSVQIMVANDSRATEWFPGVPVVADAEPGLGPLAGIETALRSARGAPVLVVAWDMPFVTAPLLRGLRALGDAGAAIVVPRHGEGEVLEPLCAYYAASVMTTCEALVRAGERRAGALAESVAETMFVPDEMLRQFGEPARLFLSVDSPADVVRIGTLSPQEKRAARR